MIPIKKLKELSKDKFFVCYIRDGAKMGWQDGQHLVITRLTAVRTKAGQISSIIMNYYLLGKDNVIRDIEISGREFREEIPPTYFKDGFEKMFEMTEEEVIQHILAEKI